MIGFNRRRGIDVSCYQFNPVILRLASGRRSHRAGLHVYIRPDRLKDDSVLHGCVFQPGGRPEAAETGQHAHLNAVVASHLGFTS